MHLPIKNLTALAVTVKVAERGSFAGASKALGLSTSAVSKSVARLEEQLGVKLFRRTTRSVSLTADGQTYVDKLRPLLKGVADLTQDLVDDTKSPKGLLRIGAPVSFGHLLLADIVAKFSRQYQDVEIELILDDSTLDLAKEQIDVSIRTGPLVDSANLIARRFMTDPMIVCASPSYLEKYGKVKSINDLSRHRRITFVNNRTGRAQPWEFKGGQQFSEKGVIRANTTDSVIKMTCGGAGLAQISLYKALELIVNGDLIEVLAEHRPKAMDYSLLYLNRKLLAPRIRVFIDFLVAEFKTQ